MEMKDKNLSKMEKITPTKSPTVDKPKKEINTKKIILFSVIALVVCGIGFLAYKGYVLSKGIGFKFDSNSILNQETPELKKDSSGKFTNALIVGIDTRETGEEHSTDTIILLSYNHETNKALMLSIPRDFNVEIGEDSGWFSRINAVYANAEDKEEGSGLKELKKTVEKVTDLEIQYYGMVDLKGFTKIVDAVGGIDVNVENSFTDYLYPIGKSYKTISFKAGPQTMDGTTALEYARSRHSQQNNEGSDYARARRQQKVIVALKDKVLSSETLTNPRKILDIISSVTKNIKVSDFTLDDIEAGLNLAKKFDEENGTVYSFVLDPTSGGYSLIEVKSTEPYAIGPKDGYGVYTRIQEYIENIIAEPALYSEKPNLYVYDTGLGYKAAQETIKEMKIEYPYINITFNGTLFKDKEGVVVYSNTEDFPNSIDTVASYLKTESKTKPEYITSKVGNGGVTILLGKEIQLETEEE